MTTKERLLAAFEESGLSPVLSQFAVAQAAHETGNFTSTVYLANNNICGMRPPQTYVIAIGSQFGYAKYNSIEDSAKALVVWLKSHNMTGLQTLEQYVHNLKLNNYYEANETEYLNGVKHFYNLYFTK
jgi:uncharacterized FlgJ-related protein